jgi:hypothetical protein
MYPGSPCDDYTYRNDLKRDEAISDMMNELEEEVYDRFDILDKDINEFIKILARLCVQEDWVMVEFWESQGFDELHIAAILDDRKTISDYLDKQNELSE